MGYLLVRYESERCWSRPLKARASERTGWDGEEQIFVDVSTVAILSTWLPFADLPSTGL